MYKFVLIVVIIFLLIFVFRNRENFDIYYNHDQWAKDYYDSGSPDADVLKSRYDWSDRDKNGDTLFDKYYYTITDPVRQNIESGLGNLPPIDSRDYANTAGMYMFNGVPVNMAQTKPRF